MELTQHTMRKQIVEVFSTDQRKDRKKRRPGLCEDIENMILEYEDIESVVSLSYLSSAAYAFILTRKAKYSSLFPPLIQAHVKLKRGSRALTVEPASFSESPF